MITAYRYVQIAAQLLLPQPYPGFRPYLFRLSILGAALLIALPLQIIHWIGFLLDEIFYREYRRVTVKQPLFVLGVPRSGTTFTHRLLAEDPRFTTVRLWECLFAPSITEKKLLRLLAHVDQAIGNPLLKLARWSGRLLPKAMTANHPSSLWAPEEDFLFLLPTMQCFLVALAFPHADWLWQLARGDSLTAASKKRVTERALDHYYRSVQKHLYVYGTCKTYLAKNASFAGIAHSLQGKFPDCFVVICERDPDRTIVSQWRAIEDACALFQTRLVDPNFDQRLLDTLHFYYKNLHTFYESTTRQRCVRIALSELSLNPHQTFNGIYRHFGYDDATPLRGALSDYEQSPQHPATSQGIDSMAKSINWKSIPDFSKWQQPARFRL